mgnify:CR=1 FL=1
MKLYPSVKKTLSYYGILGVITSLAFYLIFGYPYTPFDFGKHILLLTVPLIFVLIIGIFALKKSWYTLTNKKIIHQKGSKTYEYPFGIIVWIDHPYTKKHKILRFYTNRGDEIYLPLDSKGILYTYTMEHVKALWSFAQLKEKFPKASE